MQVATGDGVARDGYGGGEAKATTAGARRYADTLALVTQQHDFQT